MPRLRVLISGAGIAGNALGFWLSKLGHDVTLVEHFPTLRATGLQLDLRGHGIEVMKRMGLEESFRAKLAPEQGLRVVDSAGRQRAFFPANKSGEGLQNFTTEWEIMRGDLCRLMYDQTQHRAKYIFGISIKSYEERGNMLDVEFTNGKSSQYDLLVGADGQRSRTRKMMLGVDSGAPDTLHYMGGSHIGYYTMSRPIQQGEEYSATIYTATGHRFIMTRRDSPDRIQVYLMFTTHDDRLVKARSGDVKMQKKVLTEVYQGAGWETEELLEALNTENDFYLEHLGLVKMKPWYQGRVALVGDAAYCPSPNTGMGTTSGMVGAYILAGEIGKQFNSIADNEMLNGARDTKERLALAFESYDQKFRPFMDQVQAGISEDSSTMNMMPTGPWGIEFVNYLWGVAAFFKLNVLGQYFLRENVKNWDLPHYKEILRD